MLGLISLCLGGGSAFVGDEPLYAGQKNAIHLYYVVAPEGMAVGDQIRILDPVFHGVRWNRWGNLLLDSTACTPAKEQDFSDPAASRGLISVTTDGSAQLLLSRTVAEDGGSTLSNAYTLVEVTDGQLSPGEVIEVILGDDRQNPDCGHQLPGHAWRKVSLVVEEQRQAGGWRALAESPTFDILPLPELAQIAVYAPSQVQVGQPLTLRVAPMDRRGNPLRTWTGRVELSADYGGDSWTFGPDDQGVHSFSLRIDEPGIHRIEVRADSLTGRSNPIEVVEELPEFRTFWGDLHIHQGHDFLEDGETIDENIFYARDVVGLDFVTEAMKADPDCLESTVLWEHLKEQCRTQSVEDSFIYFQGFEWMGTHFDNQTGHHNFYVDSCEVDRPAYASEETTGGIDDFGTGGGPYEWAQAMSEQGFRSVIVPHATRYTTFAWTGDSINNDYRRVAEVYSGWGVSMEPFGQRGSVVDGLNSGNRMGFIAASDSHNGWATNPVAEYDNTPGVAALLAPRLGRSELMDALQARRSIGTTGARILLHAMIQDEGQQIEIGSQYMAQRPTVVWEAHGTGPIGLVRVIALPIQEDAEAVELCRTSPGTEDASGSCEIPWSGDQETAVWVQLTQEDGHQAWASPWWLSVDCEAEGVLDPLGRCAPVDSPPESEPARRRVVSPEKSKRPRWSITWPRVQEGRRSWTMSNRVLSRGTCARSWR